MIIRQLVGASALVAGLTAITATTQAASLDVDFQATIASQVNQTPNAEARYYHVSVNPANPGTGAYRANIPGTNDPAPRFVRSFDGPVVAYKFTGGSNDNINGVDAQGGESGRIVFTTTDTTFDRFGQQQGRLWTTNDPGNDLQVSGPDPYNNTTGSAGGKGGWRSLNDATGTIDVTGLAAGSVHIYYGDYNATPSVSVVMRDTDGVAPDITIAEAHLNGDAADSTEYYLAEIDFVTDGVYDVVEFVWTSGAGNGRGINAVLTEFPGDAVPPTLDPADITDNSGGGSITSVTPLVYTVTYSEFMDPATIDASDFELLGTASAAIDSVAHYGKATTITVLPTVATTGTIQLQVKALADLRDLAGNALDTISPITDPDTVTVEDLVAPTVASFESPSASGTIYATPTITYTVTFSETLDTVLTDANFTNGGTAPATIGTVTDVTPGPAPTPSVYTVEVIPSGAGTVQLEVQGLIEDAASNAMVVPVTDTKVFTLDTGTEPARETVTLDSSFTSNSTSGTHELIFDASASDKVVVIVTGEQGNPGSLAGKVNSLTYDGVAMTQAVGRLPIGSSPSGPVDQLFNDIWYLDDPAAATASTSVDDPDLGTTGNIRASVNSRAVITAIGLSGTAPGVGATAISAQEVKSVSVLAATSGGMVLASYGMGGDGNTANTGSVNTNPVSAELSAVNQGNSYDGHVTSETSVTSPGFVTATFTGGNTVGTHTIAAEFPGALAVTTGGFAAWSVLDGATGVTFDGDANGDSVQDGLAFLLGAANPNIDANSLLPVPTDDGSGGLVLTINCLPIADRGTATLYVQHSNDLVTWTPTTDVVPDADGTDAGGLVSYVVVAGPAGPPALNSVTATIDSAAAAGGKLFGRLQATE